jgi:hypothetical protein
VTAHNRPKGLVLSMAARLRGFLPLALVIGVLAFLYVEFALTFSFTG